MHRSATVVAVNTDRGARIFDHADIGVVADAGQIIRELQAAGVSR
jgi:electron transfer flavoprotein alpha subunit